MSLLEFFFDTASFMPHGYCLVWRPDLVWLHGLSDMFVMLSYFTIPAAILYLLRRRPDVIQANVAWLFIAFITLCGVTHGLSLVTIFLPVYGAHGLLKAVTAMVSAYTAWRLWVLMPGLVTTPSREQMASAEAEIKAQEQIGAELARSNAELDRFASVAAHDMRSPLHTVQGVLDWLDRVVGSPDADPDKIRQLTEMMRQQTDRMDRLLQGLLDYARIGTDEACPASVDTMAVAEEAIAVLRPTTTLDIAIDGEMPVVHAVREELAIVLRNLIGNAIKYHDRPEGSVRVRALGRIGGRQVFEVEDDGPGVPEDQSERIFERFVELESREIVEGTGLGLAMVKRIVERNHGAVSVRPGASGRGAIFRFSMVECTDPADPGGVSPAGPPTHQAASPARRTGGAQGSVPA